MRSTSWWHQPGLFLGAISAIGLLTLAACGSPATPTPQPTATNTAVPATATPTAKPAAATPTATATGPTTVVATPTATSIPTPTPVPTVQPKQGGVVKFSGGADPISFDPLSTTGGADNTHNAKMYSNLLWNPEKDIVVPDAAESYTISADGKVWTFKLRPNVKFHSGYEPKNARDGTLMTAKDVKYSMEKLMGLTSDVISPRSGFIKEFVDIDRADHGLEVIDDKTISIHLVQAFGGLANALAIGYSAIVPAGITAKDMAVRPYGSGAFRLKSFQRGASWVYERNPDYFKPGLPYLDITQQVNMDGIAIIQTAFLTGKLDIASGAGPATPDNRGIVESRVKSGAMQTNPYNSECRPQTLNMNSTKPPFNDKKLRDAINLGLDRQAYSQVVWQGFTVPTLYLDTNGLGHTADEIMKLPGWRQPHDADFQQAKATIAQLYPKGLEVKQMVRNTSSYMTEGEFLAGELKKLGINSTIELLDATIVFDRAAKLDYSVWSYYFCQTTRTPEELFGGYFVTGGSRNWIGFSDPKIDAGYRDMAATMDPAVRKQKAQAMEQTILDFMPSAPLPVQLQENWAGSNIRHFEYGITSYTSGKYELVWRADA